jgi:hypothetical protein
MDPRSAEIGRRGLVLIHAVTLCLCPAVAGSRRAGLDAPAGDDIRSGVGLETGPRSSLSSLREGARLAICSVDFASLPNAPGFRTSQGSPAGSKVVRLGPGEARKTCQ